MSALIDSRPVRLWTHSANFWLALGAAVVALTWAFLPGLTQLAQTWNTVEEYSFGWIVAPIVLFLIWQRSDQLRTMELSGNWWGLAFIVVGALLCIAGRLSLMRLFLQYGYVIAIWGLALCAIGWAGVRIIAVPLAILLLMIPLPHFVLNQASEQLQLISSALGVDIIRVCDIPVFLEGNVIDLGVMKLQVVDACSGLRYLFPLIALSLIAVYFYRAAGWKRALVVASSVPLTVAINSLRIGLIGITVEYWGPAMAAGLLHDFEGWFMFMICLGLMLVEMALLARVGNRRASLRSTFALEFPGPYPRGEERRARGVGRPLWAATGVGLLLAFMTVAVPLRTEIEPPRESFASFPLQLSGGWIGHSHQLDSETLQTLELDDYLYVDYEKAALPPVNYYIAYYASQTGAEKASHSPKTCIPGGGWNITESSVVTINDGRGSSIPANRVLIERNGQKQLVYYWFKQGARNVANDWLIKAYIIGDSIKRGRTDGALIRLVAPVAPGAPVDAVDRQLSDFVRLTQPLVGRYVPD